MDFRGDGKERAGAQVFDRSVGADGRGRGCRTAIPWAPLRPGAAGIHALRRTHWPGPALRLLAPDPVRPRCSSRYTAAYWSRRGSEWSPAVTCSANCPTASRITMADTNARTEAERLAYLKAMGIDVWQRRDLEPVAEESVEAAALELPAAGDWSELQSQVQACTLCRLHETRTQTGFWRWQPVR